MKKALFILMILIPFSINGLSQSDNPKIEIYLLDKFVQPDKDSKKFWIDSSYLKSEPNILDSEIWGYDTLTYEIFIDSIACKKLRELRPSLPIGIQFALTINKEPIITGYFWNPFSSFGCDWYMIPIICGDKLKIYKGGPEHLNKEIPELRNTTHLIKAFLLTNRVVNQNYSMIKCSTPTISTNRIDYLINDVLINNITYVRIDSSVIRDIVILKDKSQQNVFGNLNGTLKITIDKRYFSTLKLRDFLSDSILSNNQIEYVLDNKVNSVNQVLDSKVSDYKQILFEPDSNNVILTTKNKK